MPRSRACNPFALEMISGRVAFAAAADCSPGRDRRGAACAPSSFAPIPLKSFRALAATLPASVVRKNLRRVQFSIALPLGKKQIFTSRVILLVCAQHSAWLRGRQGKGPRTERRSIEAFELGDCLGVQAQ